jgi:hypothetical protein
VSFVGVDVAGSLVFGDVDIAAATAVTADTSALVGRNWAEALALRLNDNGDPVPLDP